MIIFSWSFECYLLQFITWPFILQLAKTCYNMYMSTPTKLAGEYYNFDDAVSPNPSTCLSVLQTVMKSMLWSRSVFCSLNFIFCPHGNSGTNIDMRGQGMNAGVFWNILRPETIESFMYLWRKTGDQKYRDWGWDIFLAFEVQSRIPTGYVGLKDVRSSTSYLNCLFSGTCDILLLYYVRICSQLDELYDPGSIKTTSLVLPILWL